MPCLYYSSTGLLRIQLMQKSVISTVLQQFRYVVIPFTEGPCYEMIAGVLRYRRHKHGGVVVSLQNPAMMTMFLQLQ